MELLKKKNNLYLLTGIILISVGAVFFSIFLKSDWKISVTGLKTIPETEIKKMVEFYISENLDHIDSKEIEDILLFHPRISNVSAKVQLKRISISVTESNTAYLLHKEKAISEIGKEGDSLQELITEKNHLSPDFPIFYLTVENDTEIETIKSDIIRLWEKTGSSHEFLWNRFSEIVLSRDEMNNPEIRFFHSFMPLKITFYNKFDLNSLRKIWALLHVVETEKIPQISAIRVYQDHAVME